jgi:hypothetical protein
MPKLKSKRKSVKSSSPASSQLTDDVKSRIVKTVSSERYRLEYSIVKEQMIVRAISLLTNSTSVGKDGNTICAVGVSKSLTAKEVAEICKKKKWVYKPYAKVYYVDLSDKFEFQTGYVARNFMKIKDITKNAFLKLTRN